MTKTHVFKTPSHNSNVLIIGGGNGSYWSIRWIPREWEAIFGHNIVGDIIKTSHIRKLIGVGSSRSTTIVGRIYWPTSESRNSLIITRIEGSWSVNGNSSRVPVRSKRSQIIVSIAYMNSRAVIGIRLINLSRSNFSSRQH